MTFVSKLDLSLNTFNAYSERALDIPGYIPFIGTQSAQIRISLALWQIVVSVVALVAFIFHKLLEIMLQENAPLSKHDVSLLLWISYDHSSDGFFNLCRSFFESIPFVNTVFCLCLDGVKIHYPVNKLNGHCQPITPYIHYPIGYQVFRHLKAQEAFLAQRAIA